MGSEACLSARLATHSYAWRKGPPTPRTGGEWWEPAWEGWGRRARAQGLGLSGPLSAASSDTFPPAAPTLGGVPELVLQTRLYSSVPLLHYLLFISKPMDA